MNSPRPSTPHHPIHRPAAACRRLAAVIVAGLSTCLLQAAPDSTKDAEAKPADPSAAVFEQMAQDPIRMLKTDETFRGFDCEIVLARPFVILLTRDPAAPKEATEARKDRLSSLAKGIWRNWLKVREDWQLTSTRNDTPANPDPFIWVSFHDAAAYGSYMKKFNPKQAPGSRAYYSTESQFVYCHEDPSRDPATILIHETFHQLMDRYSEIRSTEYQNYFFTEGAPEFYAGYEGEGEKLVLGKMNRPLRSAEISDVRTRFDSGLNICYPWKDRKLQITPDDWIFFDVPMLLTLRDKMWVRAISRAMVQHFDRSEYKDRPECKGFLEQGELSFHSAFYAYAWAFTGWLQHNYPEEYKNYARIVLNTDRGGDAESFLEAFKIKPARPLPDIVAILGPKNRDVTKNMNQAVACLDERVAILRQTPEIQDMHRRWADWMRKTFPKKDAAVGKEPPVPPDNPQ